MRVHVVGCNHISLEVDNLKRAIAFYADVFNLELKESGEGRTFLHLGKRQFLTAGRPDLLPIILIYT